MTVHEGRIMQACKCKVSPSSVGLRRGRLHALCVQMQLVEMLVVPPVPSHVG